MNDALPVPLRLEVIMLPVAHVDRAKAFYARLGWREDADFAFANGVRVVQFTPPGSGCSIQFGTRVTSAPPGSVRDTYLVVADIEAARNCLGTRGAEVSEVFHPTAPGAQFAPNRASGRVPGPMADHASYRSFVTFSDPDGNSFLVQEIRERVPGRGLGQLDAGALAALLRDAEHQHGAASPRLPEHHWSTWYAAYMAARQDGRTADDAVAAAAGAVTGA
jgi:catechol 2,3-dioxygenase-like lactoylglutathione lyase family enzyme